eukprot:g8019.t1
MLWNNGSCSVYAVRSRSSGFLQRDGIVPEHDEELLPVEDAVAAEEGAIVPQRANPLARFAQKCGKKAVVAGMALALLTGTACQAGGILPAASQVVKLRPFGRSMHQVADKDALMEAAQTGFGSAEAPFAFATIRAKFPKFNERGEFSAVDGPPASGPITIPVQVDPVSGGAWTEQPGASAEVEFPNTEGKEEIGFGGKLLGTVLSMDLEGMGQIPCGCQTNFYLTKAPNNDSPMTCDSGANGYGCPELDFMEGNSQALGTTLHLCDSTEGARGVFTCGWQGGCLTTGLNGKQPGGSTCDAWGCQTKTVGMQHWGKNAYGPGGYIDSNEPLNMQVYFQPVNNALENVWVQLSQGDKEPLVYSACASADYKHAVTHDLISGWSHHSTYWGGFDGMEWLNGPCPNHPSSCQGNAADHIKNVKVFKIDP